MLPFVRRPCERPPICTGRALLASSTHTAPTKPGPPAIRSKAPDKAPCCPGGTLSDPSLCGVGHTGWGGQNDPKGASAGGSCVSSAPLPHHGDSKAEKGEKLLCSSRALLQAQGVLGASSTEQLGPCAACRSVGRGVARPGQASEQPEDRHTST